MKIALHEKELGEEEEEVARNKRAGKIPMKIYFSITTTISVEGFSDAARFFYGIKNIVSSRVGVLVGKECQCQARISELKW